MGIEQFIYHVELIGLNGNDKINIYHWTITSFGKYGNNWITIVKYSNPPDNKVIYVFKNISDALYFMLLWK